MFSTSLVTFVSVAQLFILEFCGCEVEENHKQILCYVNILTIIDGTLLSPAGIKSFALWNYFYYVHMETVLYENVSMYMTGSLKSAYAYTTHAATNLFAFFCRPHYFSTHSSVFSICACVCVYSVQCTHVCTSLDQPENSLVNILHLIEFLKTSNEAKFQ